MSEKLREALEEALEPGVFGWQDRSGISAPEDAEIRRLGERIGFGALMDGASRMWAIKLKEIGLEGGEFTCGPCASVKRKWIAKAEAALTSSPWVEIKSEADLPEIGQMVCTASKRTGSRLIYEYVDWSEQDIKFASEYFNHIVAWMPIPEYKESK